MICVELCLTIRLVAEDLGLSIGACNKILTEYLQVWLISTKLVFRLSTVKQRVDQTDLREQVGNDPNFMCSIITDDKTGVYECDQETANVLPVADRFIPSSKEGATREINCQDQGQICSMILVHSWARLKDVPGNCQRNRGIGVLSVTIPAACWLLYKYGASTQYSICLMFYPYLIQPIVEPK